MDQPWWRFSRNLQDEFKAFDHNRRLSPTPDPYPQQHCWAGTNCVLSPIRTFFWTSNPSSSVWLHRGFCFVVTFPFEIKLEQLIIWEHCDWWSAGDQLGNHRAVSVTPVISDSSLLPVLQLTEVWQRLLCYYSKHWHQRGQKESPLNHFKHIWSNQSSCLPLMWPAAWPSPQSSSLCPRSLPWTGSWCQETFLQS